MFGLLTAAFLLFPAIGGTLYFLERAWLIVRGNDEHLNAVLDRDIDLLQQLWISVRGLIAPPELF